MAEPIPDFTQDKRYAVTRTLLECCMPVHPAHEPATRRLPDGPGAVADRGKRGSV